MKDATTRVLVIKNGVAKELRDLPETIMVELERAYDEAPIRGLSRDTYAVLVEFFSRKLVAYEEELASMDPEEMEMFSKTVAFAKAFDICYEESPALFDMMLMVERGIREQPDFGSHSISMRNLKSMINMEWAPANKDFRKWSRKLFEETGLKIGIVRMSKFFYGVITQLQVQPA
ncbi:MAG: hypothetical protein IJ629_01280 [Clostridia bacterium]|nr:hypothetical protein [Clostridia bacterium]